MLKFVQNSSESSNRFLIQGTLLYLSIFRLSLIPLKRKFSKKKKIVEGQFWMRKGFKMKLTLLFILFVAVYLALNAEMTLQQKFLPQRNSRTFLRFQRQRQLASLMRVPQIICSYAQYGRWPEFDTRLRPLVLQFSRIVFAMSDESIKLYCTQVSRLNQFYRPQGRPREFTLPPAVATRPATPRNFFTIRSAAATPFMFQTTPSFRSFTVPPFTTTTTTTTQRPFFTQTFATIAPTFAPLPVLPVVTIPTTTSSFVPGANVPSSATTTTTVAPSYSGSNTWLLNF